MTEENIIHALEHGYKVDVELNSGTLVTLIYDDSTISSRFMCVNKDINTSWYSSFSEIKTAKINQDKPKLLPVGTKVKVYDINEDFKSKVYTIKDNKTFGNYDCGVLSFNYSEVYPVYDSEEKEFFEFIYEDSQKLIGDNDYINLKNEKVEVDLKQITDVKWQLIWKIKESKPKNQKKHYWLYKSKESGNVVRSAFVYSKKEAKELFKENLIMKVKKI